MNANQHYRRALGLLTTLDKRLMDGDSRWNGAMYHLAMGLALDGAERTTPPQIDTVIDVSHERPT